MGAPGDRPTRTCHFDATSTDCCEDVRVQERNTFWVMERARQWIVRHDDVDLASLPSRTHAVAVAMNRAKEDQPSEVLILGPSGAIEERKTFGDDPIA